MPPPPLEHLPAAGSDARDPLLFVHGAFGTPWMWMHRYMPWFAARGHAGYALRLNGDPSALEPGLGDYLHTLERTVDAIGRAPVVIAHSLGALVAQMGLGRIPMRALAMLAPVPPTGMLWSSLRLALSAPAVWMHTTLAAVDSSLASTQATRDALFTARTCEQVVAQTHRNLRAQPARPLFEAQFPRVVARAQRIGVPALVLAAGRDRLIPLDAVQRTARHHGAVLHTLPESGHALMLDTHWEDGARTVGDWLEALP